MNDFTFFVFTVVYGAFIASFVCNFLFEKNNSFKDKVVNSLKMGASAAIITLVVLIAICLPYFAYKQAFL